MSSVPEFVLPMFFRYFIFSPKKVESPEVAKILEMWPEPPRREERKKTNSGEAIKELTYVFFSEGYPVIFSKPRHLRNLPAIHSYQGLLKMMTTNSVLVMLKTGHGILLSLGTGIHSTHHVSTILLMTTSIGKGSVL